MIDDRYRGIASLKTSLVRRKEVANPANADPRNCPAPNDAMEIDRANPLSLLSKFSTRRVLPSATLIPHPRPKTIIAERRRK